MPAKPRTSVQLFHGAFLAATAYSFETKALIAAQSKTQSRCSISTGSIKLRGGSWSKKKIV